MKLELCHADTCLPDYWRGHHKAHVSIPVYRGMKLCDIKAALRSELSQGAVAGNDDIARALSYDLLPADISEKQADQITKAAYAAINRMRPNKKGQRRFFIDLEPDEEDCDFSVYAYFVFVEL